MAKHSVSQAVTAVGAFFANLERTVAGLQQIAEQLNRKYSVPAARENGDTKRRAVNHATPKAQRQWRNQGQYMGLLKSLTVQEKANVKKVYAKAGVISAIAMANSIKNRKLANGGRRSASRGKAK